MEDERPVCCRAMQENGRAEDGDLNEDERDDEAQEKRSNPSELLQMQANTGFYHDLPVFLLEVPHEAHQCLDPLLRERVVNGRAHAANRTMSFQAVEAGGG